MNYLEVKFHDNDFTSDIVESLGKLRGYIEMQRDHFPGDRTMYEMFLSLHERNLLEPMIRKLVAASAACHDVEWATRGLHRGDSVLVSEISPLAEETKRFEEYFDKLSIEFHESIDFSAKFENGEHCSLCFRDGYITSF